MARLLELDDPACRDDRLAGGKAASLSRARAAGLPALPGLVLPVAEAVDPFAVAARDVETGGSGAARLALIEAHLDDDLIEELTSRGATLGSQIVVRSSSPLEAQGTWSGAFTSYTDATPQDLPILVRGCWASAFNLDVLERWRAAGLDAGQLAMAVLIQPAMKLEAGGLATVDADGRVTVVGMRGQPDALMAGWAPGHRAVVAPDGDVTLDEGDALDESLATRVAELSRSVLEQLAAANIEWGLSGGDLYLLQAQQGAPADGASAAADLDTVYESVEVERVAAQILASRGALGDALVLPWALALPNPVDVPATSAVAEPVEAWRRVRTRASDLIARTWRRPAPDAARAAAGLLSDLSGPTAERGIARLADLRPTPTDEGRELFATIGGLGKALAERGALPHAETVWACTPEQVDALTRGKAAQPNLSPGIDRWHWFLHATAMAQGTGAQGTPAGPGRSAARLRLLASEADAAAFRPGEVIVAPYPVNWIAPLLWGAAGLVTTGGSPAAHLVEVARWLKVPTVVHCTLPETPRVESGMLAAVDGDRGAVALLRL